MKLSTRVEELQLEQKKWQETRGKFEENSVQLENSQKSISNLKKELESVKRQLETQETKVQVETPRTPRETLQVEEIEKLKKEISRLQEVKDLQDLQLTALHSQHENSNPEIDEISQLKIQLEDQKKKFQVEKETMQKDSELVWEKYREENRELSQKISLLQKFNNSQVEIRPKTPVKSSEVSSPEKFNSPANSPAKKLFSEETRTKQLEEEVKFNLNSS